MRPQRALALSLCCILCALVCAAATASGLRYRVEGVDDELRANIRAFLGEPPQEAADREWFLLRAESRVQDALHSLGYYEGSFEIKVDDKVDPWRAQIVVEPGEVLRYSAVSVQLQGPGSTDKVLLRVVDSDAPAPGDPLHHGRYEAFKAELQQAARQRGFFDASLAQSRIDIHVAEGRAELIMVLETAERYRVGGVSVDASLLDPELLQRLLPWQPDAFYEQRFVFELRQRLLRLGYFAGVTVLPEVATRNEGRVNIRVDVTRAPDHSFEVGAGYSTDTRQRLSLSWSSPRLNSHGHSQETVLRWSPVNPAARIIYSIPLDDPANDLLQFGARLEDNEFGDLQSLQRELSLRRELTTGSRVDAVGLRLLDENWGVFDNDLDAEFVLAGVSRSWRRRRGNAVDPVGGSSHFYSAEIASSDLGSDEDLLRLYGSLTAVRRFNPKWRAVLRAEAGLLWTSSPRPDDLPPSLAFFAGGDNSIRGFSYQSVGREVSSAEVENLPGGRTLVVGGTRLLTGSLEIQRYFGESWRGALFVDAGDAFVEEDFQANVGLGFGVHYLSPVGALRLELANPVTRSDGSWRVHINIGAEF